MNKIHLLIGILVIIAASFLLAVQVDFKASKKEQIQMYIFEDKLIEDNFLFNEEKWFLNNPPLLLIFS
jgi:hypothetical protein